MQIYQNEPLKKFTLLFMRSSASCIVWHKNLCGKDLCDLHLSCIIKLTQKNVALWYLPPPYYSYKRVS